MAVKYGPCCFCGKAIEKTDTDPCRVTVSTASEKWQVWFCHGACFRERLAELEESPGFFEPTHF